MEIVYERVAGIDVHKRQITVTVRTPGARPGKRREQVRRYAILLADRLATPQAVHNRERGRVRQPPALDREGSPGCPGGAAHTLLCGEKGHGVKTSTVSGSATST